MVSVKPRPPQELDLRASVVFACGGRGYAWGMVAQGGEEMVE